MHTGERGIEMRECKQKEMNEYRYVVNINGYPLSWYVRKADAIAEARDCWRRKEPVSLYLTGKLDESGKEIRRELPLKEVEVNWIGDADERAVWFRSADSQARKVG